MLSPDPRIKLRKDKRSQSDYNKYINRINLNKSSKIEPNKGTIEEKDFNLKNLHDSRQSDEMFGAGRPRADTIIKDDKIS